MSAGRSTRAVGLLVLLGICLQMASAANIISGSTYYLKLKKSPYCKSTAQYVGYNNKKCGENGPLLRTKSDGSMSWKRWVIAVKKKENSKSWLVQLTSTWDPKVTKPTCLGRMTVSKPDLCTKGTGVADVKIVGTTSAQQWRLTEVSTNVFTIAAANRAAGCLRYLGASGNCSAPAVKLFKSDDKSGAQRFTLERVSSPPKPSPKPSPRPSPSPAPTPKKAGQPTNVRTTTVTEDTWSAAWVDGSAGVPVETYNLACVKPGAGCEASPVAATDGIARGTGSGSVVGLAAGTNYDCYVIATNSVGFVCSAPVAVKTSSITPQDVKAGKPTGVSNTVSGTTWVATWNDGTAGTPQETYTAKCVTLNAACDSTATSGVTKTNIPRGTKAANVTGLSPGTKYSCYIVAVNSAGSTCSDSVTVDVPFANSAAGQPTGVTGTLQVTTWVAKWTDGVAGVPQETYTVKCVSLNAGCNGTAIAQTPNIARGTQTGAAGPLPTGASYSCYIIAINSVSAICSAPQTVTVGTVGVKPGKPTGVTYTRTTNSVTLKWTDGTVGIPVEQYAVECNAFGTLCGSPTAPLGTPAEGINRGVQTGTTTNLPSFTRMTCYAIAYNNPTNVADDVCSDPIDVPAINPGDVLAGVPTNVIFTYNSQTASATATYTPGTIGSPLETYDAFCVAFPGGTAAARVGTAGTGTRSGQTATVTNLPGSSDLNCYVAAVNSAGTTYSAPYRLLTAATFPPGAPTALTALLGGITQTSATFTWTYGSQGTPVEDYQIRCYTSPVATCATNIGVVTSASSSRTALGPNPTITINGLTSATTYYCFVRASNVAGQSCGPSTAPGLQITTVSPTPVAPSKPGNPLVTTITLNSADITFAQSTTPGTPLETYYVRCYKNGNAVANCNEPLANYPGSIESSGVQRQAVGPITITMSPLLTATSYTCFVAARNTVTQTTPPGDDVCSQASVTFLTNPSAPSAVADFAVVPASATTDGVQVQWTIATTAGDPSESYRVKCWVAPAGSTCNSASPDFTFGPYTRTSNVGGVIVATLSGMNAYTNYRCFLGAFNAATGGLDVCATAANPATFQTLPIPTSNPSNIVLVGPPGKTSATFSWTLAIDAGVPAEQYTVKCWPGPAVLPSPPATWLSGVDSCQTTAGFIPSTPVTRPVAQTSVTGLVANTEYSCVVTATNPAGGDYCSDYFGGTSPFVTFTTAA